MEMAAPTLDTARYAAPLRRHDRKRLSSWKVLGATVAGFPAFLWQLSKSRNS